MPRRFASSPDDLLRSVAIFELEPVHRIIHSWHQHRVLVPSPIVACVDAERSTNDTSLLVERGQSNWDASCFLRLMRSWFDSGTEGLRSHPTANSLELHRE